MKNSIFDVINLLRTSLLTLNLPIHKDIKPEGETRDCIVLTYMPRKKNNINSINDIIILLYLQKVNIDVGMAANSGSIKSYCSQIESIVKTISATKGVVFLNETLEPKTDNVDTNYSVTEYRLFTINS